MVKQGGYSWNSSVNSKRGIEGNYKCKYCERRYKQSWTKDSHENICKDLHKEK